MIPEVLQQIHHLDLKEYNDPNVREELEFTQSIEDWPEKDQFLYFVNLNGVWNEFSLGQINIMEGYGAIYDAAVYTWIVRKSLIEEIRGVPL